ncbi:MAG: orotidine-5'-phosphate decarboxylase [bacterium]|nr:orotidine-5'-phosphate decarboxylase [bacterium]
MHFADLLVKKIKVTSPICVGLDPRFEQIPEHIREDAATVGTAFFEFNKGIIDAVHDLVPIVKPQLAFYEQYGLDGVAAFVRTIEYAKEQGLLVLADGKRNDIGSTAEAYAQAYIGESGDFSVDALTVSPYLGYDGIKPFLELCTVNGKGIFILVKTSNVSSGDIQDRKVDDLNMALYELVAQFVDSWGHDLIGESGYSSVGAVVAATYPKEAVKLRELMPNSIFLVPGYGAQGGGAKDVVSCFKPDGTGAIVNNSRGIIFAYEKMDKFGPKQYAEAAREAVLAMKEDLESAIRP